MNENSPLNNPELMKQTLEVAELDHGLSKKQTWDFTTKGTDDEVSLDEELGTNKTSLNFEFLTQYCEETYHLPGYDLFEKDLEDIAETAQDIKQLNYLIGHISFGFTSPLFKAEAYLENN